MKQHNLVEGDCEVNATSDNNNLVEGGAQACTTVDVNLTITSGVTQATTFRGLAIDGDASNTHNAAIDAGNGVYAYNSITDWLNFENIFRGWRKYANQRHSHK